MTMGRIISKLILSKLIPKFEDFDWLTVKLVTFDISPIKILNEINLYLDDSAL